MILSPPRDKDVTRIFWHSERFKRLDFEIREGHLVIFAYGNGQMSIAVDRLNGFVNELKEISEAYGRV